ncbi:TadE/TadG family type IV pilus assembly protein [Bosea sp. LjRoot237]|uniref:TadE/TadG family type IV pilus assembly protein n=1 Tax=Bosea sp. LjRoot237 TaxID=3342292 RepID=UPI003ECFF315
MKLRRSWQAVVKRRARPVGSCSRASFPGGLWRRLRRRACAFGTDNAGATAVEFGFVGLLFLTVLLAILQFALLFLSQMNLENALSDAATGNTTATYANNRSEVVERICGRLVLMDNCQTKLLLEMQPLTNYAASGQAIAGTVFTVGAAKEMTLMRARAPLLTVVPGLPQLWIQGQALFMRPA